MAPATLRVAWVKISMKGKPVGEARAVGMSPMQKRIAKSMAKPRAPFRAIEVMSDQGTMVEAFLISSHM